MQVIGFNLEKIHAERKNLPKGKIQINSNVNIKHVSQEKVDLIKDKNPVKFNFEFIVTHNPNISEITLIGSVLVLLDKETSKDVFRKWKDKKVPENIRIPLFNFIMSKCNLKAMQFEEEFSIPPHIPMPQIRPESDNNTNYAG